ncbi:MAG: SirB2 family protein [Pseudomonadota bacterium]
MIFSIAKNIHLITIVLSISGFLLRSYFLFVGSPAGWFKSIPKKLPHYVDTLLLGSALIMLWQWKWQINPFNTSWLAEKLFALCCYVLLGMVALHWAKNKKVKGIALGLAVFSFFYIVYVAISKTTLIF